MQAFRPKSGGFLDFASLHPGYTLALVDALRFEAPPLDQEDARHAGEIRALLAARGMPIGAYDVLIADQARARGLTLVTRNLREFARDPDPLAETWRIAMNPPVTLPCHDSSGGCRVDTGPKCAIDSVLCYFITRLAKIAQLLSARRGRRWPETPCRYPHPTKLAN